MKAGFDAIFFDNDGVLVDTEPLFLQATREILAGVGVDVTAELYHEISMRQGRSVFELVSASDEEILRLRATRNERYGALIDEGVRVLDGVRETLTRLHGTLPLAIVTSSDRSNFDRMHAQTGLVRYFELVVAEGDYTDHKPHPEPYRVAAERLGVDPARCLAIEDTERGLVSATRAGMTCITIPNELTRTADFGAAHRVLDTMHDLLPHLGLD